MPVSPTKKLEIPKSDLGARFVELVEEENRLEREALQASRERALAYRRAAFKACFRRSIKGNLWRTWDEVFSDGRTLTVTLTIFRDHRGGYSICVADSSGPTYSRYSYATESAALDALTVACVPS